MSVLASNVGHPYPNSGDFNRYGRDIEISPNEIAPNIRIIEIDWSDNRLPVLECSLWSLPTIYFAAEIDFGEN
jgi:hypothetical protein